MPVALVQRALAALNAGELDDVIALCDPAFELDMSDRVFNPATYRGHDGIRQFYAEVLDVWERYVWEPEQVFERGERVVALLRTSGTGRGSGLEVERETAMVWTVRGGKAISLRFYRDRDQALEAAGAPVGKLEVVERMIQAFVRGDFDAAMECIAPDVRWDPAMPDSAVVDAQPGTGGRERVREFFRRWLGTWQDYSYEQRELVEGEGDKVVSVFVERGTGKGSGLAVETELAGVYEVRDGVVVSWTRYGTPADAYEAAGVRE